MTKLFQPSSLDELMAMEFPPQRWLVDGLIPRAGLCMLSASPSAYKTWIMLDSARAIAKGEPLFGNFKTEQTGVLIIDEENGEDILQSRFKCLGTNDDLPIYYTSRIEKLIDEDYSLEIVNFCKENNVGIVMFDSLVRLHHSNENDSGEMSIVMNHFKRITDNGIACLVLCHHRKSGAMYGSVGDAIRGAGDQLASVDVHMALSRKTGEKRVEVIQSKNRYREELTPFTLSVLRDEGMTSFVYEGKTESRADKKEQLREDVLAYILANPGTNKRNLKEGLRGENNRPAPETIEAVLTSLIQDGIVQANAGGFKNSTNLYVKQ